MRIKNILIYGSAHLTQEACKLLKDHYNLVGHIPSVNPVIAGKMDLPIVDDSINHDIKLSIQYNRKIKNTEKSFNIHTGLLPSWGGVDILYHTVKAKKLLGNHFSEQGLTFHKMTEKFDHGANISKVTYPLIEEDTIESLYDKVLACLPAFTLSGLKLLESIDEENLNKSEISCPTIYKRGKIDPNDTEMYSKTLSNLKKHETI